MDVIKWTGEIEGYSVNYAKANVWKVKTLGYTVYDLVHDFYIVYRECMNRYKGVYIPQIFMAYYKKAVENYVIDLSNKARELLDYVVYLDDQIEESFITKEEATFYTGLSIAPQSIKTTLEIIFSDEVQEHLDNDKTRLTEGYILSKMGINQRSYQSKYFKPLKELREFIENEL